MNDCLVSCLLPTPHKMLLQMIAVLLELLGFAESWWDISPIAGKRRWLCKKHSRSTTSWCAHSTQNAQPGGFQAKDDQETPRAVAGLIRCPLS